MNAFPFIPGSITTVGTGAPSSTPSAVGDLYADTTNADGTGGGIEYYVGTLDGWAFAYGTAKRSTVTGAAATTNALSYTTVDGGVYRLRSYSIWATGAAVGVTANFNGSTTASHYNYYGGHLSNAASTNVNGTGLQIDKLLGDLQSGGVSNASYLLTCNGTEVEFAGGASNKRNHYQRLYNGYFDNGSQLSSIVQAADIASSLAVGSYIELVRVG